MRDMSRSNDILFSQKHCGGYCVYSYSVVDLEGCGGLLAGYILLDAG